MTVNRYEFEKHPSISAIVTFTGDSVGSANGEHFLIQKYNSSGPQELPMNQIAEFLNIETGRERDASGSRPIIPKEVEDKIVKDLPNHLREIDGKYVYIGPINPNWKNYFGSSSYRESIQIYNEQDNLINSANSHLQTQNPGFFTSNEARGVAQNELVIASADSQKPILGTFGAGPCVAIAVYNPTTHSAILAHIDELTNISSLNKYLDTIAKNSSEPLQVHLAGGEEESKKMCVEIIKMLNKRGDNIIKSSKLIPLGGSGESLAIDARTGEIFTSFNPDQLDLGKDFDLKNKLLGFQTNNRPINLASYEDKNPEIVKDAEPRIPEDHGLPSQTVTNTFNPSCFSCLSTLKIPLFLKRKSPSTEVLKPESSKVLIETRTI